MYAVIQTGGKQYRVEKGEVLRVEKLQGERGTTVTFNQILMVGGESHKIGKPFLEGAKVEAVITAQDRAKKIIVFKLRRRKNYRRRYGHRQPFTELRITSIEG